MTPSASPSKLRSTRWRSAGSADGADVVDADGEAALEERADLRREEHAPARRAARRRSARSACTSSGAPGPSGCVACEHADRVVLHVPRDRHLAHERLHLEDRRRGDSTGVTCGARAARRAVEDRVQLVAVRERHVELEEEAIELRLGQRIGALHLERVLRREHEERLVERVRRLGRR